MRKDELKVHELSLHMLDILQNSVEAGAKLIKVEIIENLKEDLLSIIIEDDGRGMDQETLSKIKDPFFTTRTTRKVGLGIPLFTEAARQCQGNLDIQSSLGKGTKLEVTFRHSHIDRAPLGDIAGTIAGFIGANPNIDVLYAHKKNGNSILLDTRDLKKELDGVPLSNLEVIKWISDYITL